MEESNKNLNEERAITNTLMCCQTCAFKVDYFKSKSENGVRTKVILIKMIYKIRDIESIFKKPKEIFRKTDKL